MEESIKERLQWKLAELIDARREHNVKVREVQAEQHIFNKQIELLQEVLGDDDEELEEEASSAKLRRWVTEGGVIPREVLTPASRRRPRVQPTQDKTAAKKKPSKAQPRKSSELPELIKELMSTNKSRWWSVADLASRVRSAGMVEEEGYSSTMEQRIAVDLVRRSNKKNPTVEKKTEGEGGKRRRFFRLKQLNSESSFKGAICGHASTSST